MTDNQKPISVLFELLAIITFLFTIIAACLNDRQFVGTFEILTIISLQLAILKK
jgi:hypothetical protein